jgi:hypothetical protein
MSSEESATPAGCILKVGPAAATTVVGVVSAIPTAWLVWQWLHAKGSAAWPR